MGIFKDWIENAKINARREREERAVYKEAYDKVYAEAKKEELRKKAVLDAQKNAKQDAQEHRGGFNDWKI